MSFSFVTYLFDFRSNDFQFNYSAAKKRLDFHFYLLKSFRYMKNEDFMVRFGSWTPGITAEYPLSRFAFVSASLYASYLNRVDMNTLEPQGLDAKDVVPGMKIVLPWKFLTVSNCAFSACSASSLFLAFSSGNPAG